MFTDLDNVIEDIHKEERVEKEVVQSKNSIGGTFPIEPNIHVLKISDDRERSAFKHESLIE